MAQLIDLEAGIDCTSPNGKDGKQKLKFFWDLKSKKKLCFCLTIPPPKNIQNFAEKGGEMGVPEHHVKRAANGDDFNGGRSFVNLWLKMTVKRP